MVNVMVDEARRFYEDDEDPSDVFAAFDAGEKALTTPAPATKPTAHWLVKVRHGVAVVLRHAANIIEPGHGAVNSR